MIRAVVACLLILLPACSTSPVGEAPGQAQIVPGWPPPLGDVALVTRPGGTREVALLDVGLVIFDPGIPEDPINHSKLGIFPEIRKAEARYLPYLLRQTLVDSEAWGAVRVLPQPDVASHVLVTGTILQSDGSDLVLRINAVDAAGRVWLDRVYHDAALEPDYPVAPGADPYIDLHRQIANDLLQQRSGLLGSDLARLRDVALLRYAGSLSPEAFAGFLTEEPQGRFTIARLPAQGDPMLSRVQRIQNQEYLFIDNADEQYRALYDGMAPTYNLWRQNRRELAIYKDDYEARYATREREGRRGTFAAMQQTYNAYKRSKEHDQDLDELAEGFNNEVTPTVMRVEGRVFRLSGSLEAQYSEWRDILRSIFALETGLPAVTGGSGLQ